MLVGYKDRKQQLYRLRWQEIGGGNMKCGIIKQRNYKTWNYRGIKIEVQNEEHVNKEVGECRNIKHKKSRRGEWK